MNRQIATIMRSSMTPAEKQHAIMALQGYRAKNCVTFPETCSHYERGCDMWAACCQVWVKCRLCHDETVGDHLLDRYNLEKVRCRACNHEGKPAKSCPECKVSWGEYHCQTCNLWLTVPEETSIYHCHDCNMCVKARVPTEHCHDCGICIAKDHQCTGHAWKMDQECLVCHDTLRGSVKAPHRLPCGHVLHQECFNGILKSGDIKCPACRETIVVPEIANTIWSRMRQSIEETPMPEDLRESSMEMKCNDCHHQATTRFHIVGWLCEQCGSGNTSRV